MDIALNFKGLSRVFNSNNQESDLTWYKWEEIPFNAHDMSNHNSASSLEVTEYMGIVLATCHANIFSLCNHNKHLIASLCVHLSVRVKAKI